MNCNRLPVLAALTLLLLAACSQPSAELQTPSLEPQFGTRGFDSTEDVAYGRNGYLYTAGIWDSEGDSRQIDVASAGWTRGPSEAYLRRYDRSGNLVWENFFDLEPKLARVSHEMTVHGVEVDNDGNALVAWSARSTYDPENPPEFFEVNYLSKYDRRGSQMWRVTIHSTTHNLIPDLVDLAIDRFGNAYVLANHVFGYPNMFIKYSPSGKELWRKSLAVSFDVYSIAISSSGDIYVGHYQDVTKYSSNGELVWSKQLGAAFNPKVTVGIGNEIYVLAAYLYDYELITGCEYPIDNYYYYARLYRISSTGTVLWQRDTANMKWTNNDCNGDNDSGWLAEYGLDLTTDSVGNIYTVGGADNQDAFVTKYNRSGTRLWSKLFGTQYLDGATSIATYDGSEVYVGAVTYGNLVHRNIGGSDAVLRKMDKNGNRIWTR